MSCRNSDASGAGAAWFFLSPMLRESVIVFSMAWAAVVSVADAQDPAPPSDEAVRVVSIDGTITSGVWRGVDASGLLTVRGLDELRSIPPDDVMSITFTQRTGPLISGVPLSSGAETEANATFFLADGGRLSGTFLGPGNDGLLTTTILGESVEFPFDRLAGLRLASAKGYSQAEALFTSSLDDRLPGQDILITRDAEEPKRLRGRLVSIGIEQGSFTLGQRTRTFKTDRIYALVFASGVGRGTSWPMTFELSEGASFSGKIESGDAMSLRVTTSLGTKTQLPIARLRRIEADSPRVMYVSDLRPAAHLFEGRVHRSWPVGYDKGLTGKPLAIGHRQFKKGLGCHSRTELRYELTEPFEAFVAEVGIDHVVRPRGSVVFRVLGDGAELYSSGLLTGRDDPVLVRVELEGVKALTLIVDYGDELDIADHAVWGDARLLRPSHGSEPRG